jgi:hypothetical protein
MDNNTFSKNILVFIITSYTPLVRFKFNCGVAFGVSGKISYVAFVIAFRGTPFTMRLIGWVPVPSG